MNQADDVALLLDAARVCPARLAQAAGHTQLKIEDMMADLQRVAASVANMFTDDSCFALNFEDLRAECLKKVVDVIKGGWLNRAKTRVEFFKVAKTAMNNHVRGIVQRHRFTIKRMGHASPDRNDPNSINLKPDISMDNPDVHLQVAAAVDESASAAFDAELLSDLRVFLTPLEQLVLDQLINPNPSTYMHCYVGMSRGRRNTDSISIKINYQYMADGLGMTLEAFTAVHSSIRAKYMDKIMSNKPEDIRFNSALATLENIFEVQVPRSNERIIIARLFTICARDQLQKVTPDVEKLMLAVGAKPPLVEGDRLSCYGVLYQRNHRTCMSCGLKASCQLEAANYGLGEITLSPKLLGSRNVRTPVLTDQPSMDTAPSKPDVVAAPPPASVSSSPFTPTERDEALLVYLREHFRVVKFGTAVYYTHKDGKPKCIFFVGKEDEPFELRFCKPSEELKRQLVRKVRSFYLTPEITAEDAIKLVDSHADATYAKS